jgi:hypothetical protein
MDDFEKRIKTNKANEDPFFNNQDDSSDEEEQQLRGNQ